MTAAAMRPAREAIQRLRAFFTTGLWLIELESAPRWKRAAVRFLRAVYAAGSQFFRDQCMLRASALTFYTLMSIVPLLAVVFGIAQGFGLEQRLEQELLSHMSGQEQALERIIAFSRRLLENTRGGLMAGVGFAVMFWSAVKVLGQIESALNGIWDVAKPRRWVRKFTDYLALMLIAPILLVSAGSATIFLRAQIDAAAGQLEIARAVGPMVDFALKLGPLLLVWALFTLIYLALPNARVPFKTAFAGGVFAGTLFQAVQSLYIAFQVGVASSNAIYGSFAALPLFLVWVKTSWTIFLFGAEFSYAFREGNAAAGPMGRAEMNAFERKALGLRTARRLAKAFAAGEPPVALAAMAREFKLPERLLAQVADELARGGIITEVRGARGRAFQPAFDIRQLTVSRVVEAIERSGEEQTPAHASPEAQRLAAALEDFHRAAAVSPANRMVDQI